MKTNINILNSLNESFKEELSNKKKLRESSIEDLLKEPKDFKYQLLDRLKQDCEYYLGNGNKNAKYLWSKNEKQQIEDMKALYNSFKDDEKPEWLTMEDINNYAKEMGVNGKCYIGQTYQKNGFKDRYRVKYNQSLTEALYESHKQMINKVDESEREIVYLRDELLQEIEQYGIDAFEITEVIDYAFSQAELDIKEKVYISLHKSLIVENVKNVNNIEDFNIPSGNGIFIINNTSNYGIGGYNKTSGGSGFRWTEKAKQNARDAWDDDMKAETRKRAILMWEDSEMRENLISLMSKSWSDLNLRKHVSEVLQEFWKDEKRLKDASEFSKSLWKNEEYREKISEGLKKAWENEEYRNKVINSVRETLSKPDIRKKISDNSKVLENYTNIIRQKELLKKVMVM